MENKLIEFEPWYGELGWEIMTWVPACRLKAEAFERVTASSFPASEYLYRDFVTEFRPHDKVGRSLNYPKHYRAQGRYFRYGDPDLSPLEFDILIHPRGIARKSAINYRRWDELMPLLRGLTIGIIGTFGDREIVLPQDLRGWPLERLANVIRKTKLIVGCSSGLMHFAAACGANLVVWGDRRTYFGETLEQRYKITWNPFDVRVGWIDADDWQPEPKTIADKIRLML